MRIAALASTLFVVAALAGCGDDSGGGDDTDTDAGPASGDAATPEDGGTPPTDSGTADSGMLDGGATDTDAGDSDAGGGDTDAGGGSVEIGFTAPMADRVYVRDTVMFQVSVRASEVDRVELQLDGALLVELVPPYSYVWDTRTYPERTHVVTAHAFRGGTEVVSRALEVVVDRTSPTVVSRSPGPSAAGVWLRNPFEVGFDEPVLASTVNDSSVTIAASGGSLGKTIELATDASSLSMLLTEAPASLPDTVQVSVTASVTDLAGNPMVASSWSFTADPWATIPGNPLVGDTDLHAGAALGFANDGTPYVAWLPPYSSVDAGLLIVTSYDGSSWVRVGSYLNRDPDAEATRPRIAVGSDDSIAVAWVEGASDIVVSKWNGVGWARVGSSFVGTADVVGAIDLAVDSSSNPVVSWWRGTDLIIHRWDGSAWSELAASPTSSGPSDEVPSLIIDASDRPVVAWAFDPGCRAAIWDGTTWTEYGTHIGTAFLSIPDCYSIDIALDATGAPVAAYDVGSYTYVSHWSGTAWTRTATLSSSAAEKVLTAADGTMYVSDWYTSSEQARVYTYDGSGLVSVGSFPGYRHQDTALIAGETPGVLLWDTYPRDMKVARRNAF